MTGEQKAVKIFALVLAGIICLSIFSAIMSGLSWMISWTDDSYRVGETSTETINSKEIDRLKIDLGASNLEIYRGPEFKIEKENVRGKVTINTVGSTLKIEEKSHTFWNNRVGGTIVVYISSDVELSMLDIDMGAGTVTMEDIEADEFDFDQGAGTLYMDKCKFDKTNIDGGVGKTTIKNSTLRNLDLDSGVGSIDIEAKILGNSSIEGGVGSIRLEILGSKEDYTLTTEKGIGSITVDGEKSEGQRGNRANSLRVDGGVGSIQIDFH